MHISKATLDALGDTFCVEPANGKSRNSLLESENIETFFITSRIITVVRAELTPIARVEVDQSFVIPCSLYYTQGE